MGAAFATLTTRIARPELHRRPARANVIIRTPTSSDEQAQAISKDGDVTSRRRDRRVGKAQCGGSRHDHAAA